ncbi:MAG: hypothetical protein ACREDE_11400 [Thermoplasmata archaeon]
MRSAERLEGLAIAGAASVGAVRLEVPALLDSDGSAGPGVRLSGERADRPGRRRWILQSPEARLELEARVATPEISGTAESTELAAERCWFLHFPIEDSEWERVRSSRPELVVLSNARALFAQGEPFVTAVGAIRRQLGAAPLLWAPRVALPNRLALLTYLGVDLLDLTE